jgi:hypothetical protein
MTTVTGPLLIAEQHALLPARGQPPESPCRMACTEEQAMSTPTVEIQGTLRPDGTIQLDSVPELPPGRVRVVIERLPYDPEKDPFMIAMRAIREAQRARGHVPRTKEEIDAQLREMDEADEEHARRIEKLHEEAMAARKRQEGQPEQPS